MLASLALFAGQVLAQGTAAPPPPPPPTPVGDSGGFFANLGDNISSLIYYVVNSIIGTGFADTVKTAALGMSEATKSLALVIAGALALASLLWKIVINLLQKESPMGPVLEVVIYGTVVALLITNYSALVDQVWTIALQVMQAISPGAVGQALLDYVMTIFSALGRAWTALSDRWAEASAWESAKMIFDMLGSVLLVIAVFFMMMTSIASIIGVFVMGPMFFAVGVVLGPVMIATLVADYTRGWFTKWIEFMVGSAMLTTVAVIVLTLVTSVIKAAVDRIGVSGASGLLTMMGIAILSMSFSKLFESVPSMTDALFPGRTGAGNAINTKMSAGQIGAAAVGGTGLALAAKAASATPGQVAGLASGTAGAIVAGLNAKTHMTRGLDAAGKSVMGAAGSVADGAKNFGTQVRMSDAGKAIGSTIASAVESAKGAANAGAGAESAGSSMHPSGAGVFGQMSSSLSSNPIKNDDPMKSMANQLTKK